MIYTKAANFAYPILQNTLSDYREPKFDLDVEISEGNNKYLIEVETTLQSQFMRRQLEQGKARLLLVINARDNQFHVLSKFDRENVEISKSRLSFNGATKMQLIIQGCENINYANNDELNEFYSEFKKDIFVRKGSALALSSVVAFDGSQQKPYALFEKKHDPNMASDIEIHIQDEVIVIAYRDERMMFTGIANNKDLSNPYLYMGLQKALMMFIQRYEKNSGDGIEMFMYDEQDMKSPLDLKLFTLMKDKRVKEVGFENLDLVIHIISDNVIQKFIDKIEGLYYNAD